MMGTETRSLEWQHHGCDNDECYVAMLGNEWTGLGVWQHGDQEGSGHWQWSGTVPSEKKSRGGVERSRIAAQDMAARECGFLADRVTP